MVFFLTGFLTAFIVKADVMSEQQFKEKLLAHADSICAHEYEPQFYGSCVSSVLLQLLNHPQCLSAESGYGFYCNSIVSREECRSNAKVCQWIGEF